MVGWHVHRKEETPVVRLESFIIEKEGNIYKAYMSGAGLFFSSKDCQETFDKCVELLQKKGGKICLKAGSYFVKKLTSEKPILLEGEGPATRIVPTKPMDPIDFTNIRVRDLVWIDKDGIEHDETFVKSLILFVEKVVVSETKAYGIGEEKLFVSLGSRGRIEVVHNGNGDPTLETRIYVDGELKERIPCNRFALFHLVFEKSAEVKVYSEIVQEARNSSLYISGSLVK